MGASQIPTVGSSSTVNLTSVRIKGSSQPWVDLNRFPHQASQMGVQQPRTGADATRLRSSYTYPISRSGFQVSTRFRETQTTTGFNTPTITEVLISSTNSFLEGLYSQVFGRMPNRSAPELRLSTVMVMGVACKMVPVTYGLNWFRLQRLEDDRRTGVLVQGHG